MTHWEEVAVAAAAAAVRREVTWRREAPESHGLCDRRSATWSASSRLTEPIHPADEESLSLGVVGAPDAPDTGSGAATEKEEEVRKRFGRG